MPTDSASYEAMLFSVVTYGVIAAAILGLLAYVFSKVSR